MEIHPDVAYEFKQDKRKELASEIAIKTGVSHDTAQNIIGVFGEHYYHYPYTDMARIEFMDSLVGKEMLKFYPVEKGVIKEHVQENAAKIGKELFLAGYIHAWEDAPQIVPKKDFEERIKELI